MNAALLATSPEEEFFDQLERHSMGVPKCTIMPDNSYKTKWDIWVVFILLYVALTLPYQVAFQEESNTRAKVIQFIVDGSFLIDIVLTFFTAVPDVLNKKVITNKRSIALLYLKSWLIIDIVSIIPVDLIFKGNGQGKIMNVAKFSRFARLSRMARLFRIIKMTKLFRLFKERSKIANVQS